MYVPGSQTKAPLCPGIITLSQLIGNSSPLYKIPFSPRLLYLLEGVKSSSANNLVSNRRNVDGPQRPSTCILFSFWNAIMAYIKFSSKVSQSNHSGVHLFFLDD